MERANDLAAGPGLTPRVSAGQRFEELFAAEHPGLFRALYLITGSVQEAEELMQDAFLKVWERWDRVGAMDNPAGYLHRVAINAARSRFRRLARSAKKTLTLGPPEDPFAAADLRDALVRVMAGLGERQRMALVLTDLMDVPTGEAAELMKVQPATVRSLASQARSSLRTSLEDDDA